jgi:soluble calcium-activated nucleotidase 1
MKWSTKKNIQRILLVVFILSFLCILYYFQRTVNIYLHQQSYNKYTSSSNSYDIAIIADKDKKSKKDVDGKTIYHSIFKQGKIIRNTDGLYDVFWDKEKELISTYNLDGRGMELSELIYWNGNLITCDDRSGILFRINSEYKMIPMFILTRGDGNQENGLKCEWMSVKDRKLYVGSIGKEWTDNKGEIIEATPNMYVKIIDLQGHITHVDWTNQYNILREKLGVKHPGYMIHEAVNWHPINKQWYFLPRRLSKDPYSEVDDEKRGSNVLIVANEKFSEVTSSYVGDLNPVRGFSSFKFIPGREDEVVALKSVEDGDNIESYIMIFNILNGKILLKETKVGDMKFEGVEII